MWGHIKTAESENSVNQGMPVGEIHTFEIISNEKLTLCNSAAPTATLGGVRADSVH